MNKIIINGIEYANNTGGMKIFRQQFNSMKNAKIVFRGSFLCIVSVDAWLQSGFASFVVQGYGVSSARIRVSELIPGSSISVNVLGDEEGIMVTHTSSSDPGLNIYLLHGKIDSISFS